MLSTIDLNGYIKEDCFKVYTTFDKFVCDMMCHSCEPINTLVNDPEECKDVYQELYLSLAWLDFEVIKSFSLSYNSLLDTISVEIKTTLPFEEADDLEHSWFSYMVGGIAYAHNKYSCMISYSILKEEEDDNNNTL